MAGKLSWVVITLLFSVLMLVALYLASKKIYVPQIREHAGIQAISEAVGRAAEMGRPVSFSPGTSTIYDAKYAGDTAAALRILDYVARQAVKSGSKLIVGIAQPTVLPVAQAIVKTVYTAEGKPEEYVEGDTVRFFSPDQWGFASSYVGMMYREGVAANFLFGGHAAEALVLAETGADVGAMQVSGSTNVYQLPMFIVACDYTLIGEDQLAAAAYLSPDPAQKGVVFGQDLAKLVCVALIVIGALLATMGSKILSSFLKS